MAKASSKIGLDDWQLPSMIPREVDGLTTVGVPMPDYPEIEDFEAAWFGYDPFNWELDDLNRREWATEIIAHFDQWKRYLGHDSTAIFKRTIQQKRAKGGILVGVRGIKGGGKSRLGQMVIQRICNVTPHVLFQYKDIAVQIKSAEGDEVGLLIDEDLTATGQDSANLVIHVNNSWETNRKAIQSGVCTGVNLSFEKWGNTLDIRLEPCGINPDFLATRFGMFTSKNRFLGFGALQFKHLPEDPVYYYNRLGTWREYDKEAVAFSRTVTRSGGALDAVDDISQTEHIERLKLEFKVRYIDKDLELPPDIACRRIYRKAKLPAKSIGYMNEVIWWAKDELEERKASKDEETDSKEVAIIRDSTTWKGFRQDLQELASRNGWEYAEPFAWYTVPEDIDVSYPDLIDQFNLDVLSGSLGKQIRQGRRRLRRESPKAIGDIGERAVTSWLDSCGGVWGGGGTDKNDVTAVIDQHEVAINVKTTLGDDFKEHLEVTPECDHERGFAVLLVPRKLDVKVYKLDQGQYMTINSGQGRLATPETLVATLKEMIQIEA